MIFVQSEVDIVNYCLLSFPSPAPRHQLLLLFSQPTINIVNNLKVEKFNDKSTSFEFRESVVPFVDLH